MEQRTEPMPLTDDVIAGRAPLRTCRVVGTRSTGVLRIEAEFPDTPENARRLAEELRGMAEIAERWGKS